uniref:Uncharacterized protein n=1 Tax=Panagrolaimus davidi TaxID=227884 RepID=A0A914Q4U4_9BILA
MLPTFRSLIFARQLMPKDFYRGYVIDVDERRCCINERFLTHTGIMYEKPNLGKTTFHYPPFPITGVYRDHSRFMDPNYVLQCYYDPKFEEINVLGSDALEHLKISSMNVNWKHKKFVLSRDEDLEGSKL